MAGSMFDSLVTIKKHRESKAEVAVGKQRRVLARAEQLRDAAEKTLVDYRDYAKEQERSLYRALCQRVVKLREIEDVQLAVADMRVQEGKHEQSVKEAEVQRRKEAAQLDADRQVLRDANRMKEKFVELARMHTAEMLKEFERKEEAEMEEVAETRHRPRNLHDGDEEEPQA